MSTSHTGLTLLKKIMSRQRLPLSHAHRFDLAPTIISLIQENAELALFFIRQLSIDLRISDERTVSLTQKHIRGRLAESLLFLKDTYGVEEDQCTLSIYLSREDLANLSKWRQSSNASPYINKIGQVRETDYHRLVENQTYEEDKSRK